jgi:hypothetical protein
MGRWVQPPPPARADRDIPPAAAEITHYAELQTRAVTAEPWQQRTQRNPPPGTPARFTFLRPAHRADGLEP